MSNCSVASMFAKPTSYKMPGSSSHSFYNSASRSYGSTFDTSWKNYGSSSVRPFISRTTSNIRDYKSSYSPVSRTSSVPLSDQASLLTHNLDSKLPYSSTFARERREGSESLNFNSSAKLSKQTNTNFDSTYNGYTKYLGDKHSNVISSTSVGNMYNYSPTFYKYSLNNLPLRSNVGKTPLRSVSSALLELERPAAARKTSVSFTSPQNRFSHHNSLSDYSDKSSYSLVNTASRVAGERKYSTSTSVDSLRTLPVSPYFKEHRNTAKCTENSKEDKSQLGLVGLQNIGNTCFLNSVVQCLSNTKPLLEYILSDEYLSDINFSSSMGGALIKAFSEMIHKLWQTGTQVRQINPSEFKKQIQRFAPRFTGCEQQDAQEFLRYFFEGLHEDLNRVKVKSQCLQLNLDEKISSRERELASWKNYLRCDNSKIVDLFGGQLKSTLTCGSCGNCSITFDPFWDLSLPIPERRGNVEIKQCLDLFTQEEDLDGEEKPECSTCKRRQKSTKSFCIQKFPKILVLHLKRFSAHLRRGKINLKVNFPVNDLDLRAYAANDSLNCSYNLYGVVYHSGSTRSGHYVSACKHPHSEKWHEYNDTRVSELMKHSIVTNEAYLLFYEMVVLKS